MPRGIEFGQEGFGERRQGGTGRGVVGSAQLGEVKTRLGQGKAVLGGGSLPAQCQGKDPP